ncbi:MAG: peptidase [Steroidobacteraceae bacterium]|nr:peptidase [Steroidobacteraceae bacterium]MBM2853698.1 peptidase [Steroidobacteraceae bacterium]
MRRLLLAAAMATLSLPSFAAPRGLNAADLVALARVSEAQLSPNGRSAVYTLRETDLAADRGRSDLWLIGTDGVSTPRRLTSSEENDTAADWAPDGGGIYFLSARGGSTQVWYLPVAGGEATQVTRLPLDVGSFRISPRGDRLLFGIEVFPDCGDLDCTRKRLDERKSAKQHGQGYDQLFVRHWDKWQDGRVSQLYAFALDGEHNASGSPVALTGSLDANVPSKPFGDRPDYDFSPDGSQVVFAARVRGRTEPWSTNFDVYRVPSDGGVAPVNLTPDNPAWDAQPAFSPDGRLLAHIAMDRPGFEADRFHLVVRDAATGALRFTTRDWDRSIAAFRFSADGRQIYAVTEHLGQRPIWSINIKDGARRMLTGPGNVTEFDVAGDRILFAMQSLISPVDLYLIVGHALPRRLTEVNAVRLADVRFGEPEQFSFAGAGGEQVYGYVVKPWNWEPGKSYPVAFIVHGGPQSSYANTWSYRWNPEIYAGAGLAAVFIDFHGSQGYGQAFTDSISGDWGGKPLEDLKKGLAAAAERYPWLDRDRACALGASYGGYMMNWIAGNWPDRFRCLVNHAGVFDHRTMYYSTEELWFVEWDQGGPYYDNPAAHEKSNPANHVSAWKTPMLVIHGALDYRIPYPQGIATFTALQRRGIDSRFLFFPDENHWISKPANSLQWYEEVLHWLDAHLQ